MHGIRQTHIKNLQLLNACSLKLWDFTRLKSNADLDHSVKLYKLSQVIWENYYDINADLLGGSWGLFPDTVAFSEEAWWNPWEPSFNIASSLTEIWTGYFLHSLLVAQI
jgi:hypothetical protein